MSEIEFLANMLLKYELSEDSKKDILGRIIELEQKRNFPTIVVGGGITVPQPQLYGTPWTATPGYPYGGATGGTITGPQSGSVDIVIASGSSQAV